jgi:hypothetical protein
MTSSIRAGNVVVLSTIRQGNMENPVEYVRSIVALETASNLLSLKIPSMWIYSDCQDFYLKELASRQVRLIQQTGNGMGCVRREAMNVALSLYPNASYLIWIEPEKPDMVRFVLPTVAKMYEQSALLGLFNRVSYESYPKEQALYYQFVRTVASHLIGYDLDYGFGPMVVHRNVLPYFLTYNSKYGDEWDSILIPRLHIIKDRIPIAIQEIDFINDLRMTEVESGNMDIVLKRIHQINNVVLSLIAEWRFLGGDSLSSSN